MSVNMNSGAAAISAKHRNAEGSVRVLGQTAAVAGISGALLLALKALVLVSPAVLPGGDGLDALGRPQAVAPAVEAPAAPVIFEPAAASTPVGSSEHAITRTVTAPSTTTKTVTISTPSKPVPAPNKPGDPGQPVKDDETSSLDPVKKPVKDLLDGVVPGVGSTVGGVVDTVGTTADGLVDTVNGVTGNVLKPVTDTVGVGSSDDAKGGLLPTVGNTVGGVVDTVSGVTSGGTQSGGLLGGLLG
ncbi:MAG TPA: hypothetical protein VNC22_17090 [Sporichthya sp.]|nr:hypothetical protein [Sporichthya sp.]